MSGMQRVIVTGEIGAGKTTFCSRIAELGRQAGLTVGGIISPGVFKNGRKVAIRATHLKNDETRLLAKLHSGEASGPSTKRWSFREESVQWGNRVLAQTAPCDFLIVDELGPLEFERGEGWVEGLTLIDEGRFDAAFVVVRPYLVPQALERWPAAHTIRLSSESDIPHLAKETFRRYKGK